MFRLRGCIGSTEACQPANDAVVERLWTRPCGSALPVLARGHPEIVVTVSALTPLAEISGADDRLGRRRRHRDGPGLFFPHVAEEQGWSHIELLENLARKAGLPANAWRRARLFTFGSERFGGT